MDLYTRALRFAIRAHGDQKRKYTGDPYVTHCIAVADLVAKRTDDEEIVAAALLHDTLEDTAATYDDLKSEFGSRVASIVLELTDEYTKERYPDLNRKKRKSLEAERLGGVSDDAKLVKVCDLTDNTSSIVEHDPKFASVYLVEKAAVLRALGYTLDGNDDLG